MFYNKAQGYVFVFVLRLLTWPVVKGKTYPAGSQSNRQLYFQAPPESAPPSVKQQHPGTSKAGSFSEKEDTFRINKGVNQFNKTKMGERAHQECHLASRHSP